MKGRKINKVGRDTLTISLPKEWVEKNNIQKGMDLEVEELSDKLIIHSGKKSFKEATLSIGKLSTFLFDKWMNELYIKNVDRIVIELEKDYFYDHDAKIEVDAITYINEIINSYIGLEVISQTDRRIVIQSLIKEGELKNFHDFQQRTHMLIVELLFQLVENLGRKNLHNFEGKVRTQVKNIRKFIYYCMRMVVGSNRDTIEKIKLYLMYYHLDNSLFNVIRASKIVKEIEFPSTLVRETLQLMVDKLSRYLKMREGDITEEKINLLIEDWHNLMKRIEGSQLEGPEQKLVRELRVLINLHHDFIRVYFHLKQTSR